MDIQTIAKYRNTFEQYAHKQDDVEYWLARELQKLLGYAQWRNFSIVIEKAITTCTNSGQTADDHFLGVREKVEINSDKLIG